MNPGDRVFHKLPSRRHRLRLGFIESIEFEFGLVPAQESLAIVVWDGDYGTYRTHERLCDLELYKEPESKMIPVVGKQVMAAYRAKLEAVEKPQLYLSREAVLQALRDWTGTSRIDLREMLEDMPAYQVGFEK